MSRTAGICALLGCLAASVCAQPWLTGRVLDQSGKPVPSARLVVVFTDGKVEEVGWNFEKFLIGRDGKVASRFKSAVAPDSEDLTKAIKTALEAK